MNSISVQFTSMAGTNYTADVMAHQFASALTVEENNMQANALAVYNAATAAWLTNASQNRNLGIQIPAKPTQPIGNVFEFVYSAIGSPETLTITTTQAPLGSPCPDLPPAVGTGLVFMLGPMQPGTTNWFEVGPGDTEPVGVYFMAPDGHKYMKCQFFNGTQLYYLAS